MLKLEHITILDQHKQISFKDISFTLYPYGFISLMSDDVEHIYVLGQLLSGIRKPEEGRMAYHDIEIKKFNTEDLSCYRTSYVATIFPDFQLFENRSVINNIVLGLDFVERQLNQLLKQWNMLEKKETIVENLTFTEQAKVAIIRALLRNPYMIVFDASMSPFSNSEFAILYRLLREVSPHYCVLILGDSNAQPFATRCIEFSEGHIVSDTFSQQARSLETFYQSRFHIDKKKKDELLDKLNRRNKWKYGVISIGVILSLAMIIISLFSLNLDLVDTEAALLVRDNRSIIGIEKHAGGSDKIYENSYDNFTSGDITALREQLSGTLIQSYKVQDANVAMGIPHEVGTIAGNMFNYYGVVELNNEQELGVDNIIGRYPKNYYEAALVSSEVDLLIANGILYETGEHDLRYEDILNQTFYWYDEVITITGIMPSGNENLNLDMGKYNNSSADSSLLANNRIFVKKGFMESKQVAKQESMPNFHKRITYNGYSRESPQYIGTLSNEVAYYNGKTIAYGSTIGKNEVFINFEMLMNLGYKSTLLSYLQDQTKTLEQRDSEIAALMQRIIGTTIQVRLYKNPENVMNSRVFEQELSIAGIVIPTTKLISGDYMNLGDANMYINEEQAKPLLTKNYTIDEVYYYNENPDEMKETLTTLFYDEIYSAYLADSSLIQIFIVDLKEISTPLWITGILILILYIVGFMRILETGINANKKEMSILLSFGEDSTTIKRMYLKSAYQRLVKSVIWGSFVGVILISILIFIISMRLLLSLRIELLLVLPIILGVSIILVFGIVIFIYMQRKYISDQSFDNK